VVIFILVLVVMSRGAKATRTCDSTITGA